MVEEQEEAGNENEDGQQGGDGGLAGWQWLIVLVVALVLIGIYLVLAWRVYNSRGDAAEQWARGLVVLGGIEALAFAAAGWLFGREVNRKAVENAEKQAAKAQGDAKEAQEAKSETEAELATAKVRAATMATALRSTIGTVRLAANVQRSDDQSQLLADAERILSEYGDFGS